LNDWPANYFNFFTEIEEHFQRARGTGLFVMSPLDWALVESWKEAGVPLEAVLKGIDDAFEKWRSRKSKRRLINSIAYCAQAVMEQAQRAPSRAGDTPKGANQPFAVEEIRSHLANAIVPLRARQESALHEVADLLESLSEDAGKYVEKLEDLERRLTTLEDKVVAVLKSFQSEAEMLAGREALDADLRPYRGKLTAEQLAMLERRYLDTALLERAHIPRFSLFYLH
jgi:hypothetical protein